MLVVISFHSISFHLLGLLYRILFNLICSYYLYLIQMAFVAFFIFSGLYGGSSCVVWWSYFWWLISGGFGELVGGQEIWLRLVLFWVVVYFYTFLYLAFKSSYWPLV
jgi:hypothetical protein